MLWRKYVVNAGISNCVPNSGNKLATNIPIPRNIYSVNASVPAPHLCQKTPLSCYEKVHLSNETLIHCLEICARLLHSHVKTWFASTYQMRAWSMPWNTQMTLQPCFEICPTQRKCKLIKTGINWVCQWNTSQEPMPFILWTSCKSKYWDLNRVGHRISLFLFFMFSVCFSFSLFSTWLSFTQLTRSNIFVSFLSLKLYVAVS